MIERVYRLVAVTLGERLTPDTWVISATEPGVVLGQPLEGSPPAHGDAIHQAKLFGDLVGTYVRFAADIYHRISRTF